MYVVGADEELKAAALTAVESLIRAGESLVTDAEVLQEILHRYASIDRREAILPAFEALYSVVDEVFPIDRQTADVARAILESLQNFSARDAIHVASMSQHGVTRILTFDTGFDRAPGIHRTGPISEPT